MNYSDLSLTIFIILVFVVLYVFNILSVGIKTIEDNWPVYRCEPMIMPFASVFGQDTGDNFTYCIQNMTTGFMDYLMQPLNFNMDLLGSLGSVITDAINDVREFFDYLRNMITDIVGSIFGVFLNILIEVQRLTMNVKDLFGKLIGILMSVVYTIESVPMTFESGWAGAPGQTIRFLCFEPNTPIQLKNGEIVNMKDIKLNSTLKNGAKVWAVMKINNMENGKQIENMYKINKGEENEPIYVTGSHLIYDSSVRDFIKVKELQYSKKTRKKCEELACLITSNHTIPIGKWIFHDWEDNTDLNGKTLR